MLIGGPSVGGRKDLLLFPLNFLQVNYSSIFSLKPSSWEIFLFTIQFPHGEMIFIEKAGLRLGFSNLNK